MAVKCCEVTSCKMDIPIVPPRMEEKYISFPEASAPFYLDHLALPGSPCSPRSQGPSAQQRNCQGPAAPGLGAPHGAQDGLVTSVHQLLRLLVLAVTLWSIKFSEGSTMITSSNPTAGSTSPSPELSLDISSHSFRRGPRGHKIFGHSNSVVVFCSGSGFLLWSKAGRGCHCRQCPTPQRATGGDSSLPLRQQIHVDQVGPHKLGRTNLLC